MADILLRSVLFKNNVIQLRKGNDNDNNNNKKKIWEIYKWLKSGNGRYIVAFSTV